MKIELTISVELRDWHKARKLSLKEHLGEMSDGDVTFKISRSMSGLHVMVSQDNTHREAIADLRPLIEAMGHALVEHGATIDAEEIP